jgi:hypothetical protein
MTIAGKVSDDKKFFYPDKTGFMFDTKPRDVAKGRDGFFDTLDLEYYGAKYKEITWNTAEGTFHNDKEHVVSKYNGWLNWLHKIEPDVRFSAVSDKNANCYQFPEVQYPWKFTEYIFQGIFSDPQVIEPPLYDPYNLTIVNDIENPTGFVKGTEEYKRKEGKLSGERMYDTYYEKKYYYRCRFKSGTSQDDINGNKLNLGEKRKQYEPDDSLRAINGDLESGLIVSGKRYPPWTEPDAHPLYQNSFINTKEGCGIKKVTKHMVPNRGVVTTYSEGTPVQAKSGIRLYRKDILSKCIDRGEHGNIPPYTINMSAPKEYLTPSELYKNVVTAKVSYGVGQTVYATDDGVISFVISGGLSGISDINIATVNSFTVTSELYTGKTGDKWLYKKHVPVKGAVKPQPLPKLGAKFHQSCHKSKPSEMNDGDYIHRGCTFFKGTESGCYCQVKQNLLADNKNPIDNPSDFNGIFTNEQEIFSACTSRSTEGAPASGKACRYYTEKGPVEVCSMTVEEMSSADYIKMSGYNTLIDSANDASLAISSLGLTGLTLGQMYPKYKRLEGSTDASLNGMSTTRKVTYEFEKVDLNGREIAGRTSSVSDSRYFKEGTGKFALDKQSTSFGGVDSDLFTGSNMMSRHRFNNCIMQCYRADTCNESYGTINMKRGDSLGVFAGVGEEETYCRYYNQGCPKTQLHQRAREYDREYLNLINIILPKFRVSGLTNLEGTREIKISDNSYAAVGNCSELSSVFAPMGQESSNNFYIYFLYDKSIDTEAMSSGKYSYSDINVFSFIKQYGQSTKAGKISSSSYLKMNSTIYDKMGSLPSIFTGDSIPWLVKLHDDYISPSTFESYATNLLPFIGGRMPEYRDYTKMGAEIQCSTSVQIDGYDGTLTSGKGGLDQYQDYTVEKTYRGYRIDPTGEWVIEDVDCIGDGISLGEALDVNDTASRLKLPPSVTNGAIPIKGKFSTTVQTKENSIKAKVTRAWAFSSDSSANSYPPISEDEEMIDVDTLPEGCYPKDRNWYHCAKCSPKPLHYLDGYSSSLKNFYGEPNITQIFTDFEYQQYLNCPRCAKMGITTPLTLGGTWKYFPKCRAEGIVNYFGLPGEIVDGRGFFWKNHTEISRSFVSEILSKQGRTNTAGGGFKFSSTGSANELTESAVIKNIQLGSKQVKGKFTNKEFDDEKVPDQTDYISTDLKIAEEVYAPSFMSDKKRVDGEEYHDRYNNPFSSPGLDLITADTFKSLRNRVMPVQGYPLYSTTSSEYKTKKQKSHKERFSETDKTFKDKLKGMESFILASNASGGEANYIQFWDGTLVPGKCVRAYYPTSPIWWYRNGVIGGVFRKVTNNTAIHFDDINSTNGMFGYVGNLKSASFHMLHGWLPLDKEVEAAYIYYTPSYYPEAPPLGRVRAGGPLYEYHWHSFPPSAWPATLMGKGHASYDADTMNDIMHPQVRPQSEVEASGNTYNNSSVGDGIYKSCLHSNVPYSVSNSTIAQYVDEQFGFETSQSWLTWNGFGTDLVKTKTEEAIWKKYTFQEFNDTINKFASDVDIKIGDVTKPSGIRHTITVAPPELTDGFINNAGQAITNMFDFSGINTSKVINKEGMDFAEKNSSANWATGGQVIIQSNNEVKTQSSSSAKGIDNISRINTCLGVEQVIDITKLVKEYYNERIKRNFTANGGISYSGLKDYIIANKVNFGKDNSDKPQEGVNYRHFEETTKSYWLNSMRFYPKLTGGEFPSIDSGMEYEMAPMEIVNMDESGEFFYDYEIDDSNSNSNSDSDIYKYTPHCLCITDEKGVPAYGTIVLDAEGKSSVTESSTSKCILADSNEKNLYFVLNLSRYPTQTSYQANRYEKGSYNFANVICPQANCFVHMDGSTVSVAQTLSQTGNTPRYRNKSFSQYSDKCGACGADLKKSSDAIYTGGDGLKTWTYGSLPEKDNIINAIEIEINNSINKNGFEIYVQSSSSNYWEKIINVDYSVTTQLYTWQEYSGKSLIDKTGATLPIFKGIWVDGYNLENSQLTGYHFIATRGNKVKFVAKPCKYQDDGTPVINDGKKSRATDKTLLATANYVLNNKYGFLPKLTNLEKINGAMFLEIFDSLATDATPIFSSEIQDYNSTNKTITTKEEIPDYASGRYYRITTNLYKCEVNKFRVYGFEVGDYLRITPEANTFICPINQGVTSFFFYGRATKIFSIKAINSSSILYMMNEKLRTSSDLKVEDLRYTVKKNKQNKYEIISGEFLYDTSTNSIFLPYICKDGSGDVTTIDSIYDSSKVNQATIPHAFEIKYMTGHGTSLDFDITSYGEGPSYIVEKDTITEFDTINGKYPSILPKIGKSVYFNKKGKMDLEWKVTNKERTIYNCGEIEFTGLELGSLMSNDKTNRDASAVTDSSFQALMGGGSEEFNGLEENTKRRLGGKATGKITVTGLPNCIISGILCVCAPKERVISYEVGGKTNTITERTGGMKKTGFAFVIDNIGGMALSMAFTKPKIVVYLSERVGK